MKVVYSNGKEGVLPDEQTGNLYIQNRFTKQAWEELEAEMMKFDIVEFEDPFAKQFSKQLIHIEYVRNQIKAH